MAIIDLTPPPGATPAAGTVSLAAPSCTELARLADDVNGYVEASKAANTLRAYRTDWRLFTEWCDTRGLASLPAAPETIASYVADLAGVRAVATIQRKLTSINVAHRAAGHERPTRSALVEATWKGVRRTFGGAQAKKAPLRTDDVRQLVGALGDRLIDVRDRALVLLGFAGALRRSELVALDVEDITEVPEGLVVRIRRSKTDQEGQGVSLGVPYSANPATCPVRALRAWLDTAGIAEGAIFRQVDRHGRLRSERISGRAAAARMKLGAAAIGKDPATIGGHSVRRGFITSAAKAKVPERDIMRHSRHKSLPVLRGYIEDETVWDDNAAVAVGL